MIELIEKPEKALAISVVRKGSDRQSALEYLDELEFLSETAGAFVTEKIYQELEKPNPSTVVGKGKLEEIRQIVEENQIVLAIFDDDLSPAQTRNLERELKIKILDRSGLILDIFARRAKSKEAKTQVELAQLQYLLPRLSGMWTHLSKQYGGIGTKGPGETQIETDRRMVRERIILLKQKLKEIATQRIEQRKGRGAFPQFALVGYTNAGKSTLMNMITEADVYVEDKLFATLDTTVRAFALPSGRKALLSDTVGFIRKLPTHLVASFRSTLDEARQADVLIHIVDVSQKLFREQIHIVDETLEALKITGKNIILALNKIDLIEDRDELRIIKEEFPDSVYISAKRGINVQLLLTQMQEKYEHNSSLFKLLLPYAQMNLVSNLYGSADIIAREDRDDGIYFELRIKQNMKDNFNHIFSKYLI